MQLRQGIKRLYLFGKASVTRFGERVITGSIVEPFSTLDRLIRPDTSRAIQNANDTKPKLVFEVSTKRPALLPDCRSFLLADLRCRLARVRYRMATDRRVVRNSLANSIRLHPDVSSAFL